MKVLLVIPSMNPGGAERMLTLLAGELAGRGHDIVLAAPPGDRDADLSDIAHDRVILKAHGRTPGATVRTTIELGRVIRRVQPDLIHAQNPRAATMASLATRVAGRRGRPPVLATFHGTLPSEYARAAHLLRIADHVVCVSQDLREAITTAGLPASRTSVIYNAIERVSPADPARLAALNAELGLQGAPVAAIVARIVPQKAHARFIRAARIAADRVPSARFLIVGDGPLRAQSEAQAQSSRLSDRVLFTGLRSDAQDLIARTDVLVCSSEWEGMSLAVLEAMAAGTPVLATDVQGMRELLGEGAGEIVPLDDGSALGERMAELLLDADRRSAMGAAGRRLIQARHSTATMTDAYEQCYKRLTAERLVRPVRSSHRATDGQS
jgi:glycosyltransferase involved in cell wall biosynthesis